MEQCESAASLLASVREQEVQFERLTRALEEERRRVGPVSTLPRPLPTPQREYCSQTPALLHTEGRTAAASLCLSVLDSLSRCRTVGMLLQKAHVCRSVTLSAPSGRAGLWMTVPPALAPGRLLGRGLDGEAWRGLHGEGTLMILAL
ncbi:hypothetical protein MATL_G00220690 [Megalops atlanticus]|uniref:Uncharacterized protein n=1 Tax=Megalops atlanticus TaxID=7932 RepID=A0A9D3PH55_MEGAT|nr:hypothetical protein MATL_G00220690 [Megalops atlanticus]